jgi:hypothetical protein
MSAAARYIGLCTATLFGALACTAAFNLAIDPYGLSRLVEIPRVNDRKPAEWEQGRLRKPLDLWRRTYDGIALGTSQVERGIDPDNPALRERGITLYNAGLSEARPYEQAILLRLAASTGHLKFALVSLDFLRYADGGGRAEFLPADWTPQHGLAESLKTLLSAGTVLDGLRTMAASWRKQPTLQYWPNGLSNVEALLREIGQPDYRATFDSTDGYYLNVAYAAMLARREELQRSGFRHAAVKDMIETARRSGVELHFFIGPSHARQAEIINLLGLDGLYEQWVSELTCLLADDVSQDPGRRPFPLWDLGGYNAMTTETVPPAGAKGAMRWYNDPTHYTYRAGRAIEERILDLPSPDGSELADFGEQVTPATVARHFDDRRRQRLRYLNAHPEIRQDVVALYRGPLPVPETLPANERSYPRCAADLRPER